MGVDFHQVCKCGSYRSEYSCNTGIRKCGHCHAILSIEGVYQEASTSYGMTDERRRIFFETGVDPRPEPKKPVHRAPAEEMAYLRKLNAKREAALMMIILNESIMLEIVNIELLRQSVKSCAQIARDALEE